MRTVIGYQISYEDAEKRRKARAAWVLKYEAWSVKHDGSPEPEEPDESSWMAERKFSSTRAATRFIERLPDDVEIFVWAQIVDPANYHGIDLRQIGHKDPGYPASTLVVDWDAKNPGRGR